MTSRNELPSSQPANVLESRFQFVSVISLVAKLIWLLSSYLHDSMTSRNDVMTSLNMLYLSQLVDMLARWFFFVSIVFWVDKFKDIIGSVFAYVVMS